MIVLAFGIFAFLLAFVGLILLITGIVFLFAFKKRKVLGRILGCTFVIIGLVCCIPAGFAVFAIVEGKSHERDFQGPLLDAIEQNDYDKVEKLLDSGEFDLNEFYYGSVTPLTFAIEKERQSIIGLLIAKGADVNFKDDFGATPLIKGVATANIKIINLLLIKGADVNGTDYKGYTALHLAVRSGELNIVKLLLDKKADCNIIQAGSTALDFALQYNYREIIDILKQYNAKTRRELP